MPTFSMFAQRFLADWSPAGRVDTDNSIVQSRVLGVAFYFVYGF